MMQIIGGTAVGMSTAPETIIARRLGMKVCAISTITNLAAGIKGASPSHEETKREGMKAADKMKKLLIRFFKDLK
jgi:purine-nucleoside phosphorylase